MPRVNLIREHIHLDVDPVLFRTGG
jgi:hypothetical protein